MHPLTALEGNLHTCAEKLAAMRARAKAKRGQRAAQPPAPPPGGSGRDPVAPADDEALFAGLERAAEAWPEETWDLLRGELGGTAGLLPGSGEPARDSGVTPPLLLFGPPPEAPGVGAQGDAAASWLFLDHAHATLELKLPAHASTAATFPLAGLRGELLAALDVGDEGAGAHLYAAAVRPGCTLLTLDFHVAAGGRADAAWRAQPAVALWFRFRWWQAAAAPAGPGAAGPAPRQP
jgi:hypothetical protein